MPIWQPEFLGPADNTVEATPERLLSASCAYHRRTYKTKPTGGATAPATWLLLGEHTDHSGGVVLSSLAQWAVAVTVSPNEESMINVATVSTGSAVGVDDGSVEKHSISVEEVAARATAQQAAVDMYGRPVPTPIPEGGIAARLGGVVWTMIHRQMLSRDTHGVDITVVSSIPDGIGLGDANATDVATALALYTDDTDEAPVRARLAEICSQAAGTFAEAVSLRARHTTALRGGNGTVSVIDYADGSVTQAPHPVSRSAGLSAFAVMAPAPGAVQNVADDTRRKREFIDEATRAFSVESLRLLPDASVRVADWLQAVLEVTRRKDLPTVEQARNWLRFWEDETTRAQQLSSALRSRRRHEIAELIAASQRDLASLYGVSPTHRAVVELCLRRGALSARSANAGISSGVIVLIDAPKAANFAADLSDDGLLVVPLGHGEVARKAF